MADPLSIAASVLQVAGAGLKLATTLYTYSDTVFRADSDVKAIAQDISLTASVLNELGTLLNQDSRDRLVSPTALETAESTVQSCRVVFDEVADALAKAMGSRGSSTIGKGNSGSKDPLAAAQQNSNSNHDNYNNKAPRGSSGRVKVTATWQRLKWPLVEPKMRLLQSNLERLKTTLLLMLNVITYAMKLSTE